MTHRAGRPQSREQQSRDGGAQAVKEPARVPCWRPVLWAWNRKIALQETPKCAGPDSTVGPLPAKFSQDGRRRVTRSKAGREARTLWAPLPRQCRTEAAGRARPRPGRRQGGTSPGRVGPWAVWVQPSSCYKYGADSRNLSLGLPGPGPGPRSRGLPPSCCCAPALRAFPDTPTRYHIFLQAPHYWRHC